MPNVNLKPNQPFELPRNDTNNRKVTITVPTQADGGQVSADITALPSPKIGDWHLFANLKLMKATALSPAATITVAITQADVDRAKAAGAQSFTIAYRAQNTWQTLSDSIPVQVHDATVQYSKLGDPAIGIKP